MSQGMIRIHPAVVEKEYALLLARGVADRAVTRIIKRDASVFTNDRTVKKLIANRLGWVDIAESMKKQIPAIEQFGAQVFKSGFRHVVLVGMGGSSLCPEPPNAPPPSGV